MSAAESASPRSHATASASILIVEDDRIVARDIRYQLSTIGHDVIGTTTNGPDAIKLAVQLQPDLVLMDIRLSGQMDGIGAAQEIRRRCDIPVIFLTAYADDATVQRASQAEPIGYLLKPFEGMQLRTVIEMGLHRHRANRQLRESSRQYATILAAISDAVVTVDNRGLVTILNRAAEAMLGLSSPAVVGKSLSEVASFIDPDTMTSFPDFTAELIKDLGCASNLSSLILQRASGDCLDVELKATPLPAEDSDNNGAALVIRDMTERDKVQETLRETQAALAHFSRLITFGELSVSIAREINQPLAAIMTNAATCLHWLGQHQVDLNRARQAVEVIMCDVHRTGEIVASLKAQVPKVTPELVRLELNSAISEVIGFLRTEIRRCKVKMDTRFALDFSHVIGDRAQVQQVISNLLTNSMEALSTVTRQERLVVVETDVEEEFVRVCVADNGSGISDANRDRIFEPFFTTKPQGIGMGLAICRSIIEAHSGRLWYENNSHRTAFYFTLPRHRE